MVTLSARQRALSLVPIAALSAACTVGLASAETRTGSAVPAQTPEILDAVVPMAVNTPASASPVVASARRAGLLPTLAGDAVSSIPEPALVAYQRAASIIGATDPACSLDWSLIAALGKVESDHGRARAIGPVVADAADTDGGEYDGDAQHDRGVGPLRFLPSTWSSVKVDSDGDGVRDPQDLDDAALAAAVYLCSGDEDLATASGRHAVVRRYNPAPGYASLVLGWASTYGTPVPTAAWALAAAADGPVRAPTVQKRHHASKAPVAHAAPATHLATAPTKPAQPAAGPVATRRPDPVRDLLTVTGANLLCTLDGLSALLQPAVFRTCVDDRLNRTR